MHVPCSNRVPLSIYLFRDRPHNFLVVFIQKSLGINLLSTMPSPASQLGAALVLAFLTRFSLRVYAQNTIASCGPYLLPLASCAPFVQGMTASPVQTCCDNLNRLYGEKPTCLCPLLSDPSALSSFPINASLALQLPQLCALQIEASICTGTSLPSDSPATQVSFGEKPNSTIAASPIVTVAPRPNLMGFGIHNADIRLKVECQLKLLVLLLSILTLTTY